MADQNLEFIGIWRRDNPKLAVVNDAFLARDKSFHSFSASVAEDIRPHLEELGLMPSSLIKAYILSATVQVLPHTHNFYRHGLVHLIHQGLLESPEIFNELLILEALCLFEIQVLETWPELRERLKNYIPRSQKQMADLVTHRRKLPWVGPDEVPPLPASSFTVERLRKAAQCARTAAYSWATHPARTEALKSHFSYDFAQRLFKLSLPLLAGAIAKPLADYLAKNRLLPGSGANSDLLRLFLERVNSGPLPSCMPEVLALLPEAPPLSRKDYAAALIPHAQPLLPFVKAISCPIKNLSDIPELG